jgi:hypothetical protein
LYKVFTMRHEAARLVKANQRDTQQLQRQLVYEKSRTEVLQERLGRERASSPSTEFSPTKGKQQAEFTASLPPAVTLRNFAEESEKKAVLVYGGQSVLRGKQSQGSGAFNSSSGSRPTTATKRSGGPATRSSTSPAQGGAVRLAPLTIRKSGKVAPEEEESSFFNV